MNEVFEAPGPGGWKSLADHFPGALTPEYQRLYAETCPPGMAAYMARYGVLARTVDVAFVHGHLYITPVPLFGPREIKRPPPSAALWLVARLHPETRRRTRAAARALAERPWRIAAQRWFEVERFEWQQRNQAVERLDLSCLDGPAIAEHVVHCRRLVVEGYRRHFELHGDDLLPIGLLIGRCAQWGVGPADAMRSLDGSSPVSAGTTEPPAWQLVTGYDLDSRAWCELGTKRSSQPPPEIVPLDLHSVVPRQDHGELDQLVDDARSAVPLRDDNGALTGAWPMGLLRRAMLEAGRRLELPDAGFAVEATVEELVARLHGRGGPSAADLEARHADRRRRSQLDAPLTLGPDFAIPPLGPLPRPLAIIGAAQVATADHMMGGTRAVGVGDRTHTGRALVVDDPNVALDLIEPGDVVVTRSTSPSWNAVLVHAGAIVTTNGGLVSHAAVLARELRIPAVLGEAFAMHELTTGMLVLVDPMAATVSRLV